MPFPIYRRPGGVAFLDDDPAYLEMLAEVMPEHWHVRLYQRPADCINQLQQEPPRHDADTWRQKEILDRWRDGSALIAQLLEYWRDDETARFDLTKVCVVDYSMPAMNGLQVLSELVNWSGSRVLLTGRADEQIAVSAFNQALIDQYIPKQTTEITRRLTDSIQRMLDEPQPDHSLAWRATLSREQIALLSLPVIGRQLAALADERRWVEHVVLGDPFGVLALDATGMAFWLQLEPESRLEELAEMAMCHGVDAAGLEDIRSGRRLFDVEFRLALGLDDAGLHPALRLGSGPVVFGALVPVPLALCPGRSGSYELFLNSRGPRELGDQPPAAFPAGQR